MTAAAGAATAAHLCGEGKLSIQRRRQPGGALRTDCHVVGGPGEVRGHAAQEVGSHRAAPHQRSQGTSLGVHRLAVLLLPRLLLQPQVGQVEDCMGARR